MKESKINQYEITKNTCEALVEQHVKMLFPLISVTDPATLLSITAASTVLFCATSFYSILIEMESKNLEKTLDMFLADIKDTVLRKIRRNEK